MANKYTHIKQSSPGEYSARSWSETRLQGAYRLKAGGNLDRRKSANNTTVERMYGAKGTDARIFGGALNVAYSGSNGTIVKTSRASSVA